MNLATETDYRPTVIGNLLLEQADKGRIQLSKHQVKTQLLKLDRAPSMDPTIKWKWVQALRSGHYAQSQATLHVVSDFGRPVGYCCLGVLADLDSQVREEVVGGRGHFYFPDDEDGDPENYETGTLPTPYATERYGLTQDSLSALIEFNDSGVPFANIARLIQTYL